MLSGNDRQAFQGIGDLIKELQQLELNFDTHVRQ